LSGATFWRPLCSVALSLLTLSTPSPPTCLQSQYIVNPKPFLADLTGKTVRVRLKWGQEYRGVLASSDAYMNLRLDKTDEFIDGNFAGFLGEVLIRCNNVLFIRAAEDEVVKEEGDDGAAKMEE